MATWRADDAGDHPGVFVLSASGRITVTPEELAERHAYEGPTGGWLCHGCGFGMSDPPVRCPRCWTYSFESAPDRPSVELVAAAMTGAMLGDNEPF